MYSVILFMKVTFFNDDVFQIIEILTKMMMGCEKNGNKKWGGINEVLQILITNNFINMDKYINYVY